MKVVLLAGRQWLMPIILATWGAEIGRLIVLGQPRQIVCKTRLQNNQSKFDWRCVSSVLCKREALKFKPQSQQIKPVPLNHWEERLLFSARYVLIFFGQ
jgi:hypothetical protein